MKMLILLAFVGLAAAKCNLSCTLSYALVCGTDGRTYYNKRKLETKACLTSSKVTVAYNGKCQRDSCSLSCNRVYAPVCGSDGQKYGNECTLRAAACSQKKAISIVDANALGNNCKSCPSCPRHLDPMCASDGVSYDNECLMRVVACTRKMAIIKIYDGKCQD